ncbi:tetratricopeptide repeat protein [Microbispora sp. RL4-1S]|uniref:Tetratricopeptide repeat protein n=2 Tax=Microbispora oryzae TaxID=2806554 RepID=A0A941AJT8_9ACTN|nr:tetratricopeptide repeat protein [Microbispora oryzae]
MLPRSRPDHLAEVLLSGLLRPLGGERYAFVDGAREALLATLPRSESWRAVAVLRRVSADIERRAGTAAETFTALLRVRPGSGTLGAEPEGQPFALVSPDAVRILDQLAIPLLTAHDGSEPPDTGKGPDDGAARPLAPGRPGDPRPGVSHAGTGGGDPEVWEHVPLRNPYFTGRESLLRRLRENFLTAPPQAQGLLGPGGVGKTQTALEYAWRYRETYDLVWWIAADYPDLVPSALAAMAPRLGLPPASEVGTWEAAQMVRQTLARGEPYARWLLILDGADDPEIIADLVPYGHGHVLITSRHPGWAEHCVVGEVDVFSREESVSFVRRRLGADVPDADAARLAEALGDLPLALGHAAALQRATGMSIEDHLGALDSRATGSIEDGRAEYPRSMTEAWALSVAALEDRMPGALELLRCCAFFGPEPIPRDVFRRGAAVAGPRSRPILADPILFTKALGEMSRLALVKIDGTAGTVQVHRLIQELLRDALTEETRGEFRHQVHLLLANGAPPDPEDTGGWPRFAQLVPHVGPSSLAECAESSVRRFALDVVRYLCLIGDYHSARSMATTLVQTWSDMSGPSHADVLVARGHLADALRSLGRYAEAYELGSSTVSAMRDTLGAEHADTLFATDSLGASTRAVGAFSRAWEVDTESLEAHERVFGIADRRTLRALRHLGIDRMLTGDYAAALETHQRSFMELSGLAGGAAHDLTASWAGLAGAVRLCGDYGAAIDLGSEALAYARRELGYDHPASLRTAVELSIAMRQSGEHDTALELARDAYDRLIRVWGDDHPDTLAAMVTLSNALRSAGALGDAYELARGAVDRCPAVYGDGHPFVGGCRLNLALLYRRRGDPATARDLDLHTLEALTGDMGRDHDYTLSCAVNLQSDLAALGDLSGARHLGENTYQRLRMVLGDDHVRTLACGANLAQDLRAAGLEEEGTRLHEETIDAYRRTAPANRPDAVAAREGRRVDCDFDPVPL